MEDTDLLLVERAGTSYKLEIQNMSNLLDDDLLLVERAGVSYKVTADQVNTTGIIEQPVSVLTPFNGAGLNEGQPYQPLSTAITATSDTTLTFTNDTELANMVGPLSQVDANGDVKTPVTSTIASVSADANPVLTFNSPNPDLQYFEVGDVVQDNSGLIGGNWTTMVTSSGLNAASITGDNAKLSWDGNVNTAHMAWTTNGDYLWVFTPDVPLKPQIAAEVYAYTGNTNQSFSGQATVYCNDIAVPGASPWTKYWVDLMPGLNAFGEITSIKCYARVSSNAYASVSYPSAVRVDGKILVLPEYQIGSAFSVVAKSVTSNSMTVDGGDWAGADGSGDADGDTVVTGPPLIASANVVESLNGNTLGVSGVSGSWREGLHAQGAPVTASSPSPDSIVFTSMNGGTTAFTGTDASLTSRTWTLEKSASATGPWTQVGVYQDLAATASQDGATPWSNPTLEANMFYRVKVQYDSNNAVSIASTFNTFKTGV